MIINGHTLLIPGPIRNMLSQKVKQHGVSHGLGEAGYDIRIKQTVRFHRKEGHISARVDGVIHGDTRFVLASAIEEFDMPVNLVGIVHDKSTWARRGLSVFNTVIEPGWRGFLTLELVYHGSQELLIPAGAGIAQVIFHEVTEDAAYTGKYQDQSSNPVPARSSTHEGELAVHASDGGRCPTCGEPLRPCPSGLVCKNGHGY